MVNKKNKDNRKYSSHRHVYRRRKTPRRKSNQPGMWKSRQSKIAVESLSASIEGSRIIKMEKLQEYIDYLNKHSSECGGSIILSGELRDGFASILAGSCSACEKTIKLETSNKVNSPRGDCR